MPQHAANESLPDLEATNQTIADRLRARRLLLGLSQEKIAGLCGLSPQQMHKYETGQSRLTGGRIAQLATILKVPASYFFDEDSSKIGLPADLMKCLSDPKTAEILLVLQDLSGAAKRDLAALLRTIRSEMAVADAQAEEPEADGEHHTILKAG